MRLENGAKTVQRSALCRSRRELSNAYLLAKIGVDTVENEPLEVWGENSIQYSLHSLYLSLRVVQLVRALRVDGEAHVRTLGHLREQFRARVIDVEVPMFCLTFF